jgi:hypothetical protein
MWVGVALPWQTRFVAIGDEVAIFYRLGRQISFSPQDPSVLTILDSQDELVFWAAEAGTTQLLPRPAGVEVHDSSEGCAYEDGSFHGDRRGFELEMHEEKTLLPYGELAELAGYVAVHGGNDHGSVTDGTCSDCFTAISSVALARGSLDELEATSE